jgi:hypothetical protein
MNQLSVHEGHRYLGRIQAICRWRSAFGTGAANWDQKRECHREMLILPIQNTDFTIKNTVNDDLTSIINGDLTN